MSHVKNSRISSLDLEPKSDLTLYQPFKEVEAVTITLQRPYFPRPTVVPAQLFHQQQTPVPRYTLDPSSDPSLSLQRHNLIGVQPMLVVHLLKRLVETSPNELAVQHREGGEDPGEQLLECEGRGRLQSVERSRGSRIGGVEADAYDGEELGRIVVRVDQDSTYLDKAIR